jgi:hypothetical protein
MGFAVCSRWTITTQCLGPIPSRWRRLQGQLVFSIHLLFLKEPPLKASFSLKRERMLTGHFPRVGSEEELGSENHGLSAMATCNLEQTRSPDSVLLALEGIMWAVLEQNNLAFFFREQGPFILVT